MENKRAAGIRASSLHTLSRSRDATEKTMKAIVAMVLAGFGLSMLAACNTMEGAGQDVKAAGQKVENSADAHKHY
jgi:predicted small secreted protein